MSTVLIVDDNPQDAYLLRCMLAADGFRVVEARNGREALKRAAEDKIDLVISDILMPVMDGFSFCREWKSNLENKSIPFVFYTATYVDKKDEDLALNLGADLFMVKPADPEVLRKQVAAVMAKRSDDRLVRTVEPTDEVPFLQQYNAVLVHKLEEKLLQLEKTNQDLRIKDLALASSASGILLAAPNGRVSYSNPAMVRLCSQLGVEILGQPLERLFAQPETLTEWLSSGQPKGPLELQLAPAPEGVSPVWVQVTGHAVTDDQGHRLGYMLSCLGVSEEKRLRQELARVQRLEALGLFAAGVAHDINNLLTAIYAGLDLSGIEQTPETDRTMDQEMALAAFERTRDLTRRLLNFSRGSPPQRRSVDLKQLLEESLSLALSGSSVQCERHYISPMPSVLGDPGQLAQVFNNLLVNARQATQDRGSIVVSAKESQQQVSGPLAPGRYLSIQIRDDGPGIAPDVLPHIFEPYFTTKTGGSGLGLATSQAIVQEHGGQLSVSTREGKGATFEVLIPLSLDAPESIRRQPSGTERLATRRVLIMDDQAAIQALLQRGLERAGHSVVATGNGEQALLEFERERGQGRSFDLAILDVTVRGGMGGVETLSRLRQIDPRLLAIATTGYADETVKQDLLARGFVHVLPKPFLIHELLGTVKAVLSPS